MTNKDWFSIAIVWVLIALSIVTYKAGKEDGWQDAEERMLIDSVIIEDFRRETDSLRAEIKVVRESCIVVRY